MIYLRDLLESISQLHGHASMESSTALAEEVLEINFPISIYKKHFESEKPKNANNLIADVQKYCIPISSDGSFQLLRLKKTGANHFDFIMINTAAKSFDKVFVGRFKLNNYTQVFWGYNLQKAFDLKLFKVSWSLIVVEYRGMGIGKMLYTLIYEFATKNGAGLASDSILYEGSLGMWKTYMPTIASYFGVMGPKGILLPVGSYEVQKSNVPSGFDIDGFVAMEKPPKLIRKIANNVRGLSFSAGEYNVIDVIESNVNSLVKKGTFNLKSSLSFLDIVNQSTSIRTLLNNLDKYDVFWKSGVMGGEQKLKCAIFAFNNAMIIVKQSGGKLVTVVI